MLEKPCNDSLIRQREIRTCTGDAYRFIELPTVFHGIEHAVRFIRSSPFPCTDLPSTGKTFIGKGDFQWNPSPSVSGQVKDIGSVHHGLTGFFHGHAGIKCNEDMPRNGYESSLDTDSFKKRTDQNGDVVTVTSTIRQGLIRELQKVDCCTTDIIRIRRCRVDNVIQSELIKGFKNTHGILDVLRNSRVSVSE